MATITISLPYSTAKQVDAEIKKYGFSTRSEFIRSLLRRYFSGGFALDPYTPKPLETVRAELAKTGKYSEKFIESVVQGLAKSSAYAD